MVLIIVIIVRVTGKKTWKNCSLVRFASKITAVTWLERRKCQAHGKE